MYMKSPRNTGKHSDTRNCEPLSSLLISKVFWKVGIGEGPEFSVEIRQTGGGEIYSHGMSRGMELGAVWRKSSFICCSRKTN